MSRALVIPFDEPSIGAFDEDSCSHFSSLTAAQERSSSAIGWAIKQRQEFRATEVNSNILPEVRRRLPQSDSRLCQGYACLLHFANKVYN